VARPAATYAELKDTGREEKGIKSMILDRRQSGRHDVTSTRWVKQAQHTVLSLVLLVLFAACSTGNAGPQATAPRVSPTPTVPVVPAGTVLFRADWSHGLSAWGNQHGWKLVNGMAQSDVSIGNALTVPYLLTVRNYIIECRFQVVNVPRTGGYFIIKAPHLPNKDGYTAGILNLYAPGARTSPYGNPEALIYLDPLDDMQARMAPIDYDPGSNWHTYRVQIKGPAADLFIDGSDSSTAVSEKDDSLSTGPLQVISSLAVVRISSVTITAL
jgi:hypothetical protein